MGLKICQLRCLSSEMTFFHQYYLTLTPMLCVFPKIFFNILLMKNGLLLADCTWKKLPGCLFASDKVPQREDFFNKRVFLRKLELFYTCITNYFIIALFYCTIFGKKICKNRFFVDVGCVGQKFIFSVKRFSSVIILVDN